MTKDEVISNFLKNEIINGFEAYQGKLCEKKIQMVMFWNIKFYCYHNSIWHFSLVLEDWLYDMFDISNSFTTNWMKDNQQFLEETYNKKMTNDQRASYKELYNLKS